MPESAERDRAEGARAAESPAASDSRRSSRMRTALLLLVVTGLCLALVEGGLRVLSPEADNPWAGVPSLEERVQAIRPKAPGEYRVLALGDSLTEYRDGEGRSWARVLARRAHAEGRPLTLVNLGQSGTGLRHYRKNLEDFGREVEPDLVLIGLYLGDDVLDYARELEQEARGLEVESPMTLARRPTGLMASLRRTSALAATLGRAWGALRPGPTAFEQSLTQVGEALGVSAEELARRADAHNPSIVKMAKRGDIDPWDLAFGLAQPSRYADLLAMTGSSRIPLALERLLEDVAATKALCDRLAATCVYVVLPVGLQLDERYHGYFRGVGYETAAWMTRPTPLMAALLPALRAKGVMVIDALPALKAASDRELLLPNDPHLGDEGQRVVGEAVYEALRDRAAFDAERGPPAADEPRDPRLAALLAGTALEGASDEERRLALRIAALRKAREELRELLTALPTQSELAERMQAEVSTLEKELSAEAVKRALDEARARLMREGPPEGSLLARAPALERELEQLLEREPPAASDGETVRALKRELLREQNATAALGTGASVAFRALRTLEEMKLALPELRRLRGAEQ